jgi:prepilin peptidase CpaA
LEKYLLAAALICASIGAVTDIRSSRIPNWLTYGGLASGLLMQSVLMGWRGALNGVTAGLLGGGIFFLFYLARGMGAGDVKLMAAVCCWGSLKEAVVALLATAIAGGVLAIAYVIYRRRAVQTLCGVAELVKFHLTAGVQAHPEVNLHDPASIRMPYGVAIAVGTLYALGAFLC